MDAIYLEFSKAFDDVSHKILLDCYAWAETLQDGAMYS